MKMSLFLSFLLLVLATGTSGPVAIFTFGAALLSFGTLMRKQQNTVHYRDFISSGRLQERRV
ncbi:MAG: hypothetical protein GY795_08165 [Desulfobacterales bacterium]|nr:hypothetical protein [Desulfobacterales bacterium]